MAAFWLNSSIARWAALSVGNPQANGLVRNLFGLGIAMPLTYFFTFQKTLGVISLILGLLTRLTSVWALVEFAIIDISFLLAGNIERILVLTLLFSAALVLLLNGSPKLGIDGLLAKRKVSK